MELNKEAIDQLARPIGHVWDQIAYDLVDIVGDNEEAIEMCVDARRLSMFGFPEADEFARKLFMANNIDDVYRFLSKHIRLV